MDVSTINTVMLIDDDPVSNKISQLFLRKHRWTAQVVTFEDGQQALHALRTAQAAPDVILLDVGMPVYDGWDFLEEYALLPQSYIEPCLLYLLTSSIRTFDIAKAKQYPLIKSYLTKPLTIASLNQIMQDFEAIQD